MESFKHSCPFCGQRIEYTAGYCGQQMKCPTCGQTVTFPAIAPKGSGETSLRLKSTQAKAARQWFAKMPPALAFLRDFQHWNVVGQCAVPFVIIAVLLGGAMFVKKKLGEPSSTPIDAPVVQADPDAWQKNADLTKAGQTVQAAVSVVNQCRAVLDFEQKESMRLSNSEPLQKKAADERVQQAQYKVTAAEKHFDAVEAKYRQLGGTTDYRSQLRRY